MYLLPKHGLQSNELKVITVVPYNLTCLEKGLPFDSKSSQNNPTDFSESERLRNENGRLAKEGIDQGEVHTTARWFADLE
jgi:hypothetical protein